LASAHRVPLCGALCTPSIFLLGLADNGAAHTVAIDALTAFDVVHAHPLLMTKKHKRIILSEPSLEI